MITKLGETLYHGSRREVSMLNPLNLSKDKRIPAAVFATPSRNMALAYAGAAWDDGDINHSFIHHKDKPMGLVIREMRPNALQEIYGTHPGYLYTVPDEGFQDLPGFKSIVPEVINYGAVKPSSMLSIRNVLKALQKDPTVELKTFDPKDRVTLGIIRRRAARAADNPDGGEAYIGQITKNAPPEIAELYRKAIRRATRLKDD